MLRSISVQLRQTSTLKKLCVKSSTTKTETSLDEKEEVEVPIRGDYGLKRNTTNTLLRYYTHFTCFQVPSIVIAAMTLLVKLLHRNNFCSLFSLFHLVVVVAQGSAQLVVVHVGLVLAQSPQLGHFL